MHDTSFDMATPDKNSLESGGLYLGSKGASLAVTKVSSTRFKITLVVRQTRLGGIQRRAQQLLLSAGRRCRRGHEHRGRACSPRTLAILNSRPSRRQRVLKQRVNRRRLEWAQRKHGENAT